MELILPSHARHLVKLGPDHSVLLIGLPRATYQLVAKGLGFGMTAPTTLSKPQVAKILLLSWIDVAAVLGFVVLFVVGLPLVGGRIVRRHGRFRLPVWRGGEPAGREQATVPASAGPARAATHGAPGPAVDAPGEGAAPGERAAQGQAPEHAATTDDAADDSAAPDDGTAMEDSGATSEAPSGEITLPDIQLDAADPDSWDNTGEIPVVTDVTDGPGTSQPDPGKAGDLAATPASGGTTDQMAERREES